MKLLSSLVWIFVAKAAITVGVGGNANDGITSIVSVKDPSTSSTLSSLSSPRYSIDNMTCDFFVQPLNHFVPRGRSPTYRERYCFYDGFATNDNPDNDDENPIFFYTGNESPLEQYINQTGLIWELAPKFHARVVFVEHRYEGLSLPQNLSQDCMSYSSTIQALADYARILEEHFNNKKDKAPVIVFGGSYGGMLSAWMRMKYPHLVAGAIAASAPLGAFPQSANDKITTSAQVLTAGLELPYPPPSKAAVASTRHQQGANENQVGQQQQRVDRQLDTPEPVGEDNHCRNNLLAAWPLVTWLAKKDADGSFLQEMFSLCDPLSNMDATPLLEWAQGIWFDLGEGSFPYPSSYIPFALLHQKVNLPAWPMQAACWQVSHLHQDWGVRFTGNMTDVRYDVSYGDGNISLSVDWDTVQNNVNDDDNLLRQAQHSKDVIGLLTSVRDAVSIWYNITQNVVCYNVSEVAPNRDLWTPRMATEDPYFNKSKSKRRRSNTSPIQDCEEEMSRVGSWGSLCCNDEMNLVITEARGLGQDFFWPPSLPRGVSTYEEMIRNTTPVPCPDPDGIFGYSKEPYEMWSTRLDTHFGGDDMKGHSNIVFSNGLLDPWSAGGVFPKRHRSHSDVFREFDEDKAFVQNITENDVIALIIPFGGHHTDLMYRHPSDPICATEARRIEETYISKWINQWKTPR